MIHKIKHFISYKNLKNKDYLFLIEKNLSDEVVVFDTETTGLNPKKDEILSIGAVIIKNNKILLHKKFERFLKPTSNINVDSIKIHGIRNMDLINGMEPLEAIDEFLHFIGSRTLVGYYLDFDIAMINRYVKPHLGIKLINEKIEISSIYKRKKLKANPEAIVDLKFDTIMKDLQLPIFGKHNALSDAIMTALAYIKMKNE